MKTYTDADLVAIIDDIARAAMAVGIDRLTTEDKGTCVMGAGIAVMYRAPRKRVDKVKVLIPSPFQGNLGGHTACKRALEHLQKQGFDVFWYDGIMD